MLDADNKKSASNIFASHIKSNPKIFSFGQHVQPKFQSNSELFMIAVLFFKLNIHYILSLF